MCTLHPPQFMSQILVPSIRVCGQTGSLEIAWLRECPYTRSPRESSKFMATIDTIRNSVRRKLLLARHRIY